MLGTFIFWIKVLCMNIQKLKQTTSSQEYLSIKFIQLGEYV